MTSVWWAALLLASVEPASVGPRATDDAGHTLALVRPAARVISLAPSLTELLYEAGGGDRMVGTVEYSDFPPEARQVAHVGDNQRIDPERIVRLKPDLILIWLHGNAARVADQLAALGLPLFHLEPRRMEDIPNALERIGRLVGSADVAHQAAERFRARYQALRARYAGRAPVRVFYQVAQNPILTINDRQVIADAIRLCGGRNVFAKEALLVPQLSTESVVAADPDVILTARMGAGRSGGAVRGLDDPSLAHWKRFPSLKAVKTGQLWLIPGDEISRQGPRILDGAEAICVALDEARKAASAKSPP